MVNQKPDSRFLPRAIRLKGIEVVRNCQERKPRCIQDEHLAFSSPKLKTNN